MARDNERRRASRETNLHRRATPEQIARMQARGWSLEKMYEVALYSERYAVDHGSQSAAWEHACAMPHVQMIDAVRARGTRVVDGSRNPGAPALMQLRQRWESADEAERLRLWESRVMKLPRAVRTVLCGAWRPPLVTLPPSAPADVLARIEMKLDRLLAVWER